VATAAFLGTCSSIAVTAVVACPRLQSLPYLPLELSMAGSSVAVPSYLPYLVGNQLASLQTGWLMAVQSRPYLQRQILTLGLVLEVQSCLHQMLAMADQKRFMSDCSAKCCQEYRLHSCGASLSAYLLSSASLATPWLWHQRSDSARS